MSFRAIVFASMFAALATAAVPALAKGDVEAGKTKSVTCQACHGADGAANVDPQYPRLAGQYRDYLVIALQRYKAGSRENAIMAGFSAALSEEDIDDLAAYFSSLPAALTDLAHAE